MYKLLQLIPRELFLVFTKFNTIVILGLGIFVYLDKTLILPLVCTRALDKATDTEESVVAWSEPSERYSCEPYLKK